MFRPTYAGFAIITFASSLFFMSCGGDTKSVNTENTSDSTVNSNTEKQSNDSSKPQGLKAGSINGFLNTLWTDSGTFNRKGRRIVFRFYAKSPDSLTLDGWTAVKDTFPVPPVQADILLNIGGVSTIPFGNKTYFGNLILQGDDRKNITDTIRHGSKGPFKYVLFIPLNPQNPAQAHQITYEIRLTNDDPIKMTGSAIASAATNVNLNPSPPRNPR